jgi:hypothetical protein
MPDSAQRALDSATARAPMDPAARADLARIRVLIAGSQASDRPLH